MFPHSQPKSVLVFLFLLALPFAAVSCNAPAKDDGDLLQREYSVLDEVVEKKKAELFQYLDVIEKSISSIRDDGPLIDSFEQLNQLYTGYRHTTAVPRFDRNTVENVLVDNYLNRFLVFENIYFINDNGDVFYSLIKNSITLENVFTGKLAKTALSKKLHNNPNSYVVDFDIFPGLDPAAFFIHPVYKDATLLGWCVFELGASRLDTIFSSATHLGKTGEVFLVNEHNAMLTNSYFSPELSALKQHLSPENIITKFRLGKGHLEITDYRGYRAITSFEVVAYHNVRWLVIAKKDLDEVLTQQFMKSPKELYRKIRENSRNRKIVPLEKISFPTSKNEVKLDQFKRIHGAGDLYTHGVSTCTAVLINLPAKFSYLAHISAYDVLYGGERTDIISNIIDRIKKYEIPDYLLRDLHVYIVSPRIQFDQNILEELVGQGLLLSQIYVAKNIEAKRANVYHNIGTNQGFIRWDLNDGRAIIESIASLKDVSGYLTGLVRTQERNE